MTDTRKLSVLDVLDKDRLAALYCQIDCYSEDDHLRSCRARWDIAELIEAAQSVVLTRSKLPEPIRARLADAVARCMGVEQ